MKTINRGLLYRIRRAKTVSLSILMKRKGMFSLPHSPHLLVIYTQFNFTSNSNSISEREIFTSEKRTLSKTLKLPIERCRLVNKERSSIKFSHIIIKISYLQCWNWLSCYCRSHNSYVFQVLFCNVTIYWYSAKRNIIKVRKE